MTLSGILYFLRQPLLLPVVAAPTLNECSPTWLGSTPAFSTLWRKALRALWYSPYPQTFTSFRLLHRDERRKALLGKEKQQVTDPTNTATAPPSAAFAERFPRASSPDPYYVQALLGFVPLALSGQYSGHWPQQFALHQFSGGNVSALVRRVTPCLIKH